MWTLLGGNMLTELGMGFFVPILPLYLVHRGGDPLLVGIVLASGVAGRAAAQYPGGWLSDRVGRRPVMLVALASYAVLFLPYLFALPVDVIVPLRFVQAFLAGLYFPAATALVADLTPLSDRGVAYGRLRASEQVGWLLGPALGGVVASVRLDAVFLGSAVLCMVATLLLLRLPNAPPGAGFDAPPDPDHPLRLLRLVAVPALLGAPIFFAIGTYSATWSLYMAHRGAGTIAIGLSFAIYALPILLFAGFFGRLVDRGRPLRLAAMSVAGFACFLCVYPFVSNVPVLVLLGALEGVATGAGQPALAAEVSRRAPAGRQGTTQAVYNLVLIVAEGLGSIIGAGLYGRSALLSFGAAAVVCAAGLAGAALVVRRRPAVAS